MKFAKAHSEASLAAHIYHGWTLCGVQRDPVSGCVSEHVLRWDLPGHPRKPSAEEILLFVHVSNIEDKFEISGRGVVIAPGLPRDKGRLLKHGSIIVLFDYQESALLTQVQSIELSHPPSPKGWAILLPPEICADQIQIGMQVWARTESSARTLEGFSMISRGSQTPGKTARAVLPRRGSPMPVRFSNHPAASEFSTRRGWENPCGVQGTWHRVRRPALDAADANEPCGGRPFCSSRLIGRGFGCIPRARHGKWSGYHFSPRDRTISSNSSANVLTR